MQLDAQLVSSQMPTAEEPHNRINTTKCLTRDEVSQFVTAHNLHERTANE